MTTILLTTKINGPINKCFDAARSIELHQHSMRQFNETAINGITSGLINNGESVTWKAKHFGINMKMTVGITEMSPPHSFTDELIKGPFKSMKHQHLFSTNDGITIMEDVFEFQSPFGLAGKLFERLFLKMYMKNLLVTRNKVIKSNVEGSL
jgi:ligand-binding SRPBCC domain-containing protein